jgi:16S rRNA (cytidine1402-2'-O)-methyltransferase
MPQERRQSGGNRDGLPAFTIGGQTIRAAPLPPGLYLVATPIGNLSDISLRALAVLAAANLVACEDTRVTRKLLNRYGIRTRLIRHDDHASPPEREHLLMRIAGGEAVALVSDAGTPLVSDPGYRLVAEAAVAGLPVVPVPGASAAVAALSASGLPSDRFLFAGFLPAKAGERRRAIDELRPVPATLVLYEAPHRLGEALAALAEGMGDRPAAVARELTKLHEEIRRGTLSTLAIHYSAEPVRGEVAIVIAPPGEPEPPSEADLDRLVAEALETRSVKDAATEVAARTGVARRDVYRRALALSQRGDEQ